MLAVPAGHIQCGACHSDTVLIHIRGRQCRETTHVEVLLAIRTVQREIVPLPEPTIVGQGLRSIQHGLDEQQKGVSAAKVVFNGIQAA